MRGGQPAALFHKEALRDDQELTLLVAIGQARRRFVQHVPTSDMVLGFRTNLCGRAFARGHPISRISVFVAAFFFSFVIYAIVTFVCSELANGGRIDERA